MNSPVRILIVDDRLHWLENIAALILDRHRNHPRDFGGRSVQLELAQSATFVTRQIQESQLGSPRWDLILSDVFMPDPEPAMAKRTKVHKNEAVELSIPASGDAEQRRLTCWRLDTKDQGDGTSQHGGFLIAECLKELRVQNPESAFPKLVLVSSFAGASNQDLRRLQPFVREHAWFTYMDKPDGNAVAIYKGVFTRSIAQFVRHITEPTWGDGPAMEKADCQHAVLNDPRTRQLIQELRAAADAKHYTTNSPKVVYLIGEPGTGKTTWAQVLARMACPGQKPININHTGNIDTALESTGTALILDDVHAFTSSEQARATSLMKDGRLNGYSVVPSIVIVTAASSYQVPKGSTTITLPMLKDCPGNFIGLWERALMIADEGVNITLQDESAAMDWMKAQPWPENYRQCNALFQRVIQERQSTIIELKAFSDRLSSTGSQEPRRNDPDLTPGEASADPPYQMKRVQTSGGYKWEISVPGQLAHQIQDDAGALMLAILLHRAATRLGPITASALIGKVNAVGDRTLKVGGCVEPNALANRLFKPIVDVLNGAPEWLKPLFKRGRKDGSLRWEDTSSGQSNDAEISIRYAATDITWAVSCDSLRDLLK